MAAACHKVWPRVAATPEREATYTQPRHPRVVAGGRPAISGRGGGKWQVRVSVAADEPLGSVQESPGQPGRRYLANFA